jgi:hypothetical protein
VRDLKEHYERKGVSNKELKDRLTIVLNELIEPMRQRRAKCEGTCRWCGKRSNMVQRALAR